MNYFNWMFDPQNGTDNNDIKTNIKTSLSTSNLDKDKLMIDIHNNLPPKLRKNLSMTDINYSENSHDSRDSPSLNNSDIWIDNDEHVEKLIHSVVETYEQKIEDLQSNIQFEITIFSKIMESIKNVNTKYCYYQGLTHGILIGLAILGLSNQYLRR